VEASDLNADRKDKRPGSGISLQTLIIASFASAVASFAASRIWGAGTLISAAVTPVIVALVAEFLRRPVQTVAATAKKVPTVQSLPAVRKRTIAATEDPTGVRSDPTRVTTDSATRDEPQSYSGLPEPRLRVESSPAIATRGEPGDDQGRRGQHLASTLATGRRDRPARLRDRRRSLHGAGPTRRTLHHRQRPADDVLRRLGECEEQSKPDVDGDDGYQDRTDDTDDQNHDDRGTDDQDHDDQNHCADWHADRNHDDR